jgi:hypothetical protein
MNPNQILNFNRGLAILAFVGQSAKELAADQTAMPDGNGTVASRYADLAFKLEPVYLQIIDAAKAAKLAGNNETADNTTSSDAPQAATAAPPVPVPALVSPPPSGHPRPHRMAGNGF